MAADIKLISEFVQYAQRLKGDEKGEAQVFCDRLFHAFGHAGYKEAGATLEERVRGSGKRTRFVDLVWRPRLLLEMKSRGEQLQRHYRQAFEYWLDLVPQRPRYVVLCNFDEFWVYDFDNQLDEPVDRIALQELPKRFTALNFLFPDNPRPQFGNDRVAVTRAAADKVATAFNAMIERGEQRERAQRFVLQSVVAMFAEDFDLLPRGLFSELLADCANGQSSYDLLGGLFRQMNEPERARGGRFRDVAYFDGGLFATVDGIELTRDEVRLLQQAASEDWSLVQPPIFGTLFQGSMDQKARHAYGAHFTSEADIQKVVLPTIVRPWRERIARAGTLKELSELSKRITEFRVLDPACGSGNFLYVAYRELVGLEMEIIRKIHDSFGRQAQRAIGTASLVSSQQCFGIDNNPFAVELAKVTLMLGKRLALAEARKLIDATQKELPLIFEEPLPLDNLDANIRCDDALFCAWPKAEAIIGNPPYQSKNKMQAEFGRAYLNRVRDRFPDVPGRADYCVYWFRRAHDALPRGGRAGLVGTNTIRQNYSREGGLDYIVDHGGTISEAVSSQVWSGDAVVHVSIVNWVKGAQDGRKRLYTQLGDNTDSPWRMDELSVIPSSLSSEADVTDAKVLRANSASAICAQGQTHGHEGFLLTPEEAGRMVTSDQKNREVLFPYLIGDDLLGTCPPCPQRMVIDFHPRDVFEAKRYAAPFAHVEQTVLAARQAGAREEEKRNAEALAANSKARVNRHHANFLKRWWLLSYPREDLIERIAGLPRYIACSRVTKRPVFEFIDSRIRPSDSLQVFAVADDYSFGILQSGVHWQWFVDRCSTLKGDFRYTSNTVFDTFPWPQSPSSAAVAKVARAGRDLRKLRRKIMAEEHMTYRDLYRTLELPGANALKDAQAALDQAARVAYGLRKNADVLEFLLKLNHELADREAHLKPITGPGLPATIAARKLVSEDCVTADDSWG